MIEKVTWLCFQQGLVLFARTKGREPFYTVGGKIEPGETPIQALLRETREEVGIDLEPMTAVHVVDITGPADGHSGGKLVTLHCYRASPTPESCIVPSPHGEIAELAWFGAADRQRTTETGRLLLDWLHQRHYII